MSAWDEIKRAEAALRASEERWRLGSGVRELLTRWLAPVNCSLCEAADAEEIRGVVGYLLKPVVRADILNTVAAPIA